MDELMAGCCQIEVITADVQENVRRAEAALGQLAAKGCRLAVLPEMWSCGFPYPELAAMAAKTPVVLEQVRSWAARLGMVIVGSLPEAEGETVYNSSFVVDATGEVIGRYRKIHLFTLHGEHEHFGRGLSPLVCETAVGRLGVMICYDLRFPELARRLALEGAQILCVSALWPSPRIAHWSLLLRARAVENQLFVVGCNGSGVAGKLHFGGTSALVTPLGSVLAEGDAQPRLLAAPFALGEIERFRGHIDCFADRVPEAYALNR